MYYLNIPNCIKRSKFTISHLLALQIKRRSKYELFCTFALSEWRAAQ